MANVLSYINSGSLGASSGAATSVTMPIQWCRPQHKPTQCVAIRGTGSCCLGVPSNATCYVIEMWGQGGQGAGGCCCGVGSYGGQGGTYSYVTCTTSGQAHCLCGCVCACGSGFCGCTICSICSGSSGQFTYVCDCSLSIYWCVSGGEGGIWCCNPSSPNPWCYACGSSSSQTFNNQNTYQVCLKCMPLLLATATATTSGGTFLQACCGSQGGINIQGSVWTGCASTPAPATPGGGGASGWTSWNSTFPTQTCSCFTPGFVWRGACGWSDQSKTSTPAACLNSCTSIVNSQFCGFGVGVGGAAYAGGDQAFIQCNLSCGNNGSTCGNQNGNWPGGGGMSSHSRTSWSQPGSGAPGLILMSYC